MPNVYVCPATSFTFQPDRHLRVDDVFLMAAYSPFTLVFELVSLPGAFA